MASINFAQWSFHFATSEGRKWLGITLSDADARRIAGDQQLLERRYQAWRDVKRAQATRSVSPPPRTGGNAQKPPTLPGPAQSSAGGAPTSPYGTPPPIGASKPAKPAPADQVRAARAAGEAAAFPAPYANVDKTSNGYATTGFVLGIVSIFFFTPLIIGVPVTLGAIVFSIIGLTKFSPRQKGRWMPIVGLCLGVLYLLVGLIQTARAMA